MRALGLPGETTRQTKQLTAGITYTSLKLSGGSYGTQNMFITEADLNNRNVYVSAALAGEYLVSKATVTNIAAKFKQDNPSHTPYAAINGDLYAIRSYHSNPSVTTQLLAAPHGFTMINGEIISTRITQQEEEAVNPGAAAYDYYAFGITEDFIPNVGQPNVDFAVKNVTKNTSTKADALNRQPANNALMLYSDKCNTSNYALADALEIVLDNVSGAFKHGQTLRGTVSAIGTGGQYGLQAGRVVLSARGSAKTKINAYAVGDTVEIAVTITDGRGNHALWQRMQSAVGGRNPLITNGVVTGWPSEETSPRTVVGYTWEGKVVTMVIDGRGSGGSEGMSMTKLIPLCQEMGIASALVLDGGGSATMVVNEGSGVKVVNRPSDGSQRAVVNGIVISTGPTRRAMGNLNATPLFNAANIQFNKNSMLQNFSRRVSTSSMFSSNSALLWVSGSTRTPSVTLPFGNATPVSADTYKYIVVNARVPAAVPAADFSISPITGSLTKVKSGFAAKVTLTRDDKFHSYLFDFSGFNDWKGTVHALKLDYLSGNQFSSGDTLYLQSIRFAKTKQEAESYMISSPTATPTPTPGKTTARPTEAPTPTPAPTEAMETPTATPLPGNPTNTQLPTATASATASPAPTPSPAREATPTAGATAVADATAGATPTPSSPWLVPVIAAGAVLLAAAAAVLFVARKKK